MLREGNLSTLFEFNLRLMLSVLANSKRIFFHHIVTWWNHLHSENISWSWMQIGDYFRGRSKTENYCYQITPIRISHHVSFHRSEYSKLIKIADYWKPRSGLRFTLRRFESCTRFRRSVNRHFFDRWIVSLTLKQLHHLRGCPLKTEKWAKRQSFDTKDDWKAFRSAQHFGRLNMKLLIYSLWFFPDIQWRTQVTHTKFSKTENEKGKTRCTWIFSWNRKEKEYFQNLYNVVFSVFWKKIGS